jgi:filamentous hemagglutinin family protein
MGNPVIDYLISPDLGQQVGGNLFHSFGEFSIGVGEVAKFTGPDSVNNVVSRVTGGSLSRIDGTLRSSIDGAALYLLNPAGISFGETAHVDVMGSFHASTADVLRFADGVDFDVFEDPPLLSAAEPSAFGFTRPDPGLISVSRSQDLAVPEGETLSLIGGFDSDFPSLGGVQIISASGAGENIRAPGATVQLAAARPGIDVPVDLTDLDMEALNPGDLGNVVLQNSAWVDVSTPPGSDTPAGTIVIRGERFIMQTTAQLITRNGSAAEAGGPIDVAMIDSIELGDRSQITTWTQSDAPSGTARLAADRISLDGSSRVNTFTTGAGTSGAVELEATTIDLAGGAQINSQAFGNGTGGAIDIRAETLRISNAANDSLGTFISTNTLSQEETAGDGGSLAIEAASVELVEGGQVFARTSGAGNAGALTVNAIDRVHLSGRDDSDRPSGISSRAIQTATGQGGTIAIEAPVVEVMNGAQIASDTFGAGAAGALEIVAGERVTIEGGEDGFSLVGAGSLFQAGSPDALGPAGEIRIDTGTLELRGGGQVAASNSSTLPGGQIRIEAARVAISGQDSRGNQSGVFSQSLSPGPDAEVGRGGDIFVAAVADIDVFDGGRISASSDGSGNAGNIELNAGGAIQLASGAQITTEAENASGGQITIEAAELVYLLESDVSTSVAQGEGGGGDVRVGPPSDAPNDPPIVVLNRSDVRAEAFEGPGGNLTITAAFFFQSADSVLSASSELGIDGIIAVEAPETDLPAELPRLPIEYRDLSSLLRNPCAARTARAGSFVVQRQGPLSAPPDGPFDTEGLPAVAAPPETLECPREEEVR